MKPLPDDILEAAPFRAFLTEIGAVGFTQVAQGGRCYGVMAARSNSRWWLLPLDSRRAALAGLDMFQPVSLAARLVKIGAQTAALCGPLALLGRRQIRLSGLPDLSDAFGARSAHIALFTGTDGPHRKTTLQIMDDAGLILGYAKLTLAPHIRPYLRNEADILRRVASLRLQSAEMPKVMSLQDGDLVTMLVTDSNKSAAHTAPLVLGSAHFEFLTELRGRTERPGAGDLLDDMAARINGQGGSLAASVGSEWRERFCRIDAVLRPHIASLPLCLCHGDFTPWNTFLQSRRLYIFDWEYARFDWPVGFDLTHFMLSTMHPAVQAKRLPDVVRTLAAAQFDGDARRATRALLLSLACHAMFYLARLQEACRPLDSWSEGRVRANLIDWLLDQEGTL